MRNGVIYSPRPAVNRYASGMTRRGVLSRARVAAKVRYLSVRIDVWSTCSAYTSLSLSLGPTLRACSCFFAMSRALTTTTTLGQLSRPISPAPPLSLFFCVRLCVSARSRWRS